MLRLAKRFGILILMSVSSVAYGGGPRWYTGTPYFPYPGGQPIVFYTTNARYYTDPGNLNANVSHAQADAMVAAAAAVWNVPTSSLTLSQGGTLDEHVNGSNTYFDGTQMVLPDDVKATNYLARPIAIVYDIDGSVIETLLGAGASDPSGCRQNAVVESMDGLDHDGTIHHAVVLLNGRCVGASPDQLTQMQYQLAREFGRVIGLAWSQLNDNVFTGVPTPIAAAMNNWPLMHPIDVLCGPLSYKCMAQPFTLRQDDLCALALLYPVTAANITPGKALSAAGSSYMLGYVYFPTAQGMDAVNVVVRKEDPGLPPDFAYSISAVTGLMHKQFMGNPVTGAPVGVTESMGSGFPDFEGMFVMQRIPIEGTASHNILFYTTEAINPLYTGDYAIGPYVGSPAAMSGPSIAFSDSWEGPGGFSIIENVATGAASTCNPGNDGAESAPAVADASGWWSGLLCANQHTSWWSQTVKPGRSWTLEVTALDENGVVTTNKARPLLGVWNGGDAMGTLPTVAATGGSFNSTALGTTQLPMDAASGAATYRIAVADERGKGRPDFAYKMRVLYADDVFPAQVAAAGGRVTITGEGFRVGNRVTVNGVAATVVSWSANSIVATTPSSIAAKLQPGVLADVAVVDVATGGTSVIHGALSFAAASVNQIGLVFAPSQIETGVAAMFAVRVTSDGVTAVAGAKVRMAATGSSAAAMFAPCSAQQCNLTTDASGFAQSGFTATAAGTLALMATELSGAAQVQATVVVTDPVRTVSIPSAMLYLAAGSSANWSVTANAQQNGLPAAGVPVTWTASAGLSVSASTNVTDASGAASIGVSTTGLPSGLVSVQGCAWVILCASASVLAVDPAEWVLSVSSGAGQSVQAATKLAPVVLLVTDATGHPLQAATVNVYQTVDRWNPCPASGRCPATPVLTSSRTVFTTDAAGLISVTPLEVSNTASTVNIAASSGTQGFVSLVLVKTP